MRLIQSDILTKEGQFLSKRLPKPSVRRDLLYRIHGTLEPRTIGSDVSSGCIRLLPEDLIDLYDRVPTGTHVLVMKHLV